MEYWRRRPSEEIDEELRRLKLSKDEVSHQETLNRLVEEITRLTRKYSSRSSSLEEKTKTRPAATLKWNDFIVRTDGKVDRSKRKDKIYPMNAFAPETPPTKPKHEKPSSTTTPPSSVVGNGMSPEELRRRVMGGGATEMADMLDRSRPNTAYSATTEAEGDTQTTTTGEPAGRFGRYRDSAIPENLASAADYPVDEDGWIPSYVLGAPLRTSAVSSQMPALESEYLRQKEAIARRSEKWTAKAGFVAETSIMCGPDMPDNLFEASACVIRIPLKKTKGGDENAEEEKITDLKTEAATFALDTGRTQKFRTLCGAKKLFKGGHPLGDAAVTPACADSFGPVMKGIHIDGVFDATFLSQYDLDIDFKKNTASFFEAGSLLRHNPSIEGGQLIDLPLSDRSILTTVSAKLRKDPTLTPEGLMQIRGDEVDALAVVSTAHFKSFVTPDFAARFTAPPSRSFELMMETLGAVGGGPAGSKPNSCDAIDAAVEFATDSGMMEHGRQRIEVMDRDEIETLKEYARRRHDGRMPDMIIGLDLLAGPENSNRLSISWAHERIRISVPKKL
eukprot:CAMPEP_0184480218 /NCGR_PEP_ID=MMETSP0113_2-20130426/1697_1 /TAXON_ID=91329 /ORGANISM="Norrisiella sphaerica, Strain BC52" /LENGTH=561 /DNA_ID=CAMNT_0026858543 /DNA_START=254 /DNA_END=1939 /DNA_ORIENTATION=-